MEQQNSQSSPSTVNTELDYSKTIIFAYSFIFFYHVPRCFLYSSKRSRIISASVSDDGNMSLTQKQDSNFIIKELLRFTDEQSLPRNASNVCIVQNRCCLQFYIDFRNFLDRYNPHSFLEFDVKLANNKLIKYNVIGKYYV